VYKLSQYIGTLIVSCVSATLMPNISETKPLGSSCPIGSLRESAYGRQLVTSSTTSRGRHVTMTSYL